MQRHAIRLSLAVAGLLVALAPVQATQLDLDKLETKLVTGPVEYAVLLPDGFDPSQAPLPLLFFLHGGGQDRGFLTRSRPFIEEMWKAGTLPRMVVATPSAARSFYMDYKDGTQKWETFLLGPFLDHLKQKYHVTGEPKRTFLTGVSMGGLGSLRLAFKYPERFAAVAAIEPGIDPVLKWKDLKPRYRFYRSPELMETIFGKPFDEAYWEANNPATLAVANAAKIRASGLAVYLECGDEDSFYLHEAAEFLHRTLWDHGILHEYHLIRGADHVGRTLRSRQAEGLAFLARVLNPPAADPTVETLRKTLNEQKRKAGVIP